MRTIDINIVPIVVIIGVLAAIIVPRKIQQYETVNQFYEVYTDELHRGGWVPNIFPTDIKKIHTQHDIDTNYVWLRFDKGETEIELQDFVKLTRDEKSELRIRKPFNVSSWFPGLIERQPANDGALIADVYKGRCGASRPSYLAVPHTGITYYWWCAYNE